MDDLHEIYDYGQMVNNTTTTFADLNELDDLTVSAVTLAPGQWLPVDQYGGHFTRSGAFREYKSGAQNPAHLLLEFDYSEVSPGYLNGASANGYTAASGADTLPAIMEMPANLEAECGYPAPLCLDCDPCTYCADTTEAGMELERIHFNYLGETETSHYYVSSIQTTFEELRSEWSLDWSTFASHLIHIDNATENDSILTLMESQNVDRIWLGITDDENYLTQAEDNADADAVASVDDELTDAASEAAGTDVADGADVDADAAESLDLPTIVDGTWVSITDFLPIAYENWDHDEDLSGTDHQFANCDEVDYASYDYAQLWRTNQDRRWHLNAGCDMSTSMDIASPRGAGKWIPMPDHGTLISGAYLAHLVLEYPKSELSLMSGNDTDGNGICNHQESRQCLPSVIETAFETDTVQDVLYIDLNGQATQSLDSTVYLVGTGIYKLLNVPSNRALRMETNSPFIQIFSSTTQHHDEDGFTYHSGTVEIAVTGDFGTNGFQSFNGETLASSGKLHFHYPTDSYNCAGICELDANFNNICDELEGCMEEDACNYNPTAVFPGICVDAEQCTGCMQPTACNYDINATKADDASCLYEDPDNCIFCEDILDGSGQAESQDIDGDGYCDRFEGCTDPTACNYKLTAEDDIDPITLENKNDYQFPNNPHLNNPDAVNGCIYVDYTSTPCGFCSPSENGFGFVINGDIDEDGLCDVFDSDRRIPLRMVYHAGGLGGDSVVFTGPYSNLAFIPFDMAREEYGARTTYSRFSNLQFGQPFDITIQDAGTFDKTFMGMMGGSGNTAASADAISTNAYAPTSVEDVIQSSSEVLSDSWSKFSADDVGFTRTTTEGFTPAMQGEFQALSVDDSGVIILSNLAYDHSDLTDESNYSNISLKVAATGTDAHYGSSSLTPCVDTTGYSFWSTQLPSSTVRPAFCQEFNTLNTQLGTITANLSRAESTTAHPVFRSATFISGNDNNRDYYTLNAKANGQKLTWQEAHDYDYDLFTGGTLSSGAAELSALSDGEINDISLLNNSDEAWLDASLSVTAGIVASDNASNGLLWKWKNTTVENAFPTGHVQSPLLGIDSKGPGTTSNFPLLNGSSSRNGVAYEDLRINNGRAYVRSTSRQNFSKFNAESTFGFIASTSSEQTWVKDYVPGADRIWNYITRNTAGTWSCKTTGESTFYQDWVAGTPPTGHVNGVFKFHNIDYCQLVSDLNSYPKIVSGASNGRQKVTIPSSSIKMVPVGRDGRLYDIHIVGNIFGRWQETGYYLFNRRTLGANQDVSFKYELPSFSAASGGSQPSNAAFEDLDVMGTVYFFLWTADKHTYSWYYNKLREWGVSPGTFGNNSSMEQYVVGDYDWTWGDM
ncbi:MAG: hypothetical protein ACPGGB_06300, partial [Flavobacteriales bacterium]